MTGLAAVSKDAAADLVAALGELVEIHAGSEADAGTYKYRYASLGQIMSVVRPVLAAHNLAVSQPVSAPMRANC